MWKWWIKALFTPTCWVQNHRYDANYSKWLKQQIDNGGEFTEISRYTAKLNGTLIWISNHPYASMVLYDRMASNTSEFRASRAVTLYAYDALQKQRMEKLMDENIK